MCKFHKDQSINKEVTLLFRVLPHNSKTDIFK